MFTAKPWGYELLLIHTDKYAAKKLFIFPGQRLSKQYHKVKKESLIYLSGDGFIELGEGIYFQIIHFSGRGKPITITAGGIHRICAHEGTHLELLEISTGEIEDVVRLEDDYSRVAETTK